VDLNAVCDIMDIVLLWGKLSMLCAWWFLLFDSLHEILKFDCSSVKLLLINLYVAPFFVQYSEQVLFWE